MTNWQPIKASDLSKLPEFPYYEALSKFESLSLKSTKPLLDHQYGVKGAKDILKPHNSTIEALKKNAKEPALSGYTHSCGLPESRKALAAHYSTKDYTIPTDNAILFQGSDMAQNHLMRAFCNPGDNFLIPTPSAGLWAETAPGYSLTCKTYKLVPEKNWEVDLEDLESKIDEKTKFILVANPSNPGGSVYSEAHLKQILAIAEKHKLPIVADEALEDDVFEGELFVNLGHISGDVPVIQMGGLGEKYFAFGWNTSWIVMYDRIHVMDQFLKGLQSLMQLMLHPATFVCSVIIDVLEGPQKGVTAKEIMPRIKKNADTVVNGLKNLDKYLKAVEPKGGFSMLVLLNLENFKDVGSEKEFVEKLYEEENVKLMPSGVYHYEKAVRVTTCLEEETYGDLVERLENFCKVHGK